MESMGKAICLVIAGLLAVGFLSSLGRAENTKPMEVGSQPAPMLKYTTHAPIRINSDADFDTQFPGRIISGYEINGTGYGCCIFIGNCSQKFIVQNCYLHNSSGRGGYFFYDTGIYLYKSSNGTLSDNFCNGNKEGIAIEGNNTVLMNNKCNKNSLEGIDLLGHYNVLMNNTCIENTIYGISMVYSYSDIITNNNISGNSLYGIHIYSCSYNRIHHNIFIDNALGGKQSYDETGRNFWNDTDIGNFWSDWTSPDNDSNGFVDAPYVLDGGVKDYHPIADWSKIPEPIPAPLIILSVVLLAGIVTYTRRKSF